MTYDASHFVLQQLDYLEFIRLYGDRIKAFHVKDAEFRPDGRVGVYGGYQSWNTRAGRFRSLGDGQVDFKRVFTLLTEVFRPLEEILDVYGIGEVMMALILILILIFRPQGLFGSREPGILLAGKSR